MTFRSSVFVAAAALLMLVCQPSATNAAVLFNVGLPRTGTTSVHRAIPLLNFTSNHVAFNTSRFDLEKRMGNLMREFRESGQGPLRTLFDQFDAFSDTPAYGLIGVMHKHMPWVKMVATSRSKESWLDSMRRNPHAGGEFLIKQAGLLKGLDKSGLTRPQILETLYDNHARMLEKFSIPKIDIQVKTR